MDSTSADTGTLDLRELSTFQHRWWDLATTRYTLYTVSEKNDTGVAHYNFNVHQPILVIIGRDVAERGCYQMVVICYPTSPN